jgi:hypothetical protein
MSTDKAELVAARAAYYALRHLERHEAESVMEWVRKRLDSDERGREATQYPEIEPTDWIEAGSVEGPSYSSRDECAADESYYDTVLEVIGRAPVRQCSAAVAGLSRASPITWAARRTIPTPESGCPRTTSAASSARKAATDARASACFPTCPALEKRRNLTRIAPRACAGTGAIDG